VSVTYAGIKNLSLNASMLNSFDKDPPRSVQDTTFQRGYDPPFTDRLPHVRRSGVIQVRSLIERSFAFTA
jgi:outer membrane receptor protein involved in Fe transport